MRKILLSLAANPLFWIVAIVGGLFAFIAIFEEMPSFGVIRNYKIF